MDIDEILDTSSSNAEGLVITTEIREFLRQAAKWAKFLAITGFVMLGLFTIGMLVGGLGLLAGPSMGVGAEGGMVMLLFLAILGLYVLPILYLYRYATNTQKALTANDQRYLRDAFMNLKSLFKFMGILTIITLGLYALAMVGGLLAFLMNDMM